MAVAVTDAAIFVLITVIFSSSSKFVKFSKLQLT